MDVSEITRFKPGSLQQGAAPTEGINVHYFIGSVAVLWTCVCVRVRVCAGDINFAFRTWRRLWTKLQSSS